MIELGVTIQLQTQPDIFQKLREITGKLSVEVKKIYAGWHIYKDVMNLITEINIHFDADTRSWEFIT